MGFDDSANRLRAKMLDSEGVYPIDNNDVWVVLSQREALLEENQIMRAKLLTEGNAHEDGH